MRMDAKKGDWVQVRQVVLTPEERAAQVPEDTRQVPLVLWIKGRALKAGRIGEPMRVRTVPGRIVSGILEEVCPGYSHDFGEFVEALATIGPQVRALAWSAEVAGPEVEP